ncbi:TetR/AcrR family transcriptional regulator [Achromobacter aloeverae]|uniref:TetR/AcrR family transcriptional regulator n=1 Tax=Achromobacter aloeverae TaxID=1750518 RepID=A0A4Q1HM73_9BURK|nr:TetR/AcrR family transcriptional regulator [Achromobacter aloeverae]RXN91290.1 TetR/AcrR family transcriptional regulator [Achromobacter aloeverae]
MTMRMSREESQAATRCKLLAAATKMFAREGYAAASVDRIAAAAGYSKGAFYSNFESKEQIFLELLEAHGEASLGKLLDALDGASDVQAAIEAVSAWADAKASEGNWSLLVLEHQRYAKPGKRFEKSQEAVFRSHWRRLGGRLAAWAPDCGIDAEKLGAVVFELTHAPAMTFVRSPSAGDLVRYALDALLAPGGRAPRGHGPAKEGR